MIYTEPFVVTGGGPGNATTFLSIDLVKIALGQSTSAVRPSGRWSTTSSRSALCWILIHRDDR